MRRFCSVLSLTLPLLFGLISGLAYAADAPPPHAREEKPAPKPHAAAALLPADSITHHKIRLGGSELSYTATAGTLPLRDAEGTTVADIFYVSFTLDGAGDHSKRPITYAFNGGPGAASAYLDIGALGPRALDFAGGKPEPSVNRVSDNPASWLPFTDLVFIDPVGTGYSRAVNEDQAKKLWSVEPDLQALAQIIRLHLARSDRLASPVYVVGESYGGFRAARLAELLAQREGIAASGIMLISPVIEFDLLEGTRFDVLPWALRLPSYAAVELAQHHALTPQALAEPEHFALGDYLVGLAAGPTERPANFYARIASLIGLDEATVARWNGRVPPGAYAKALHRAEGEILSRYDGTVLAPDPDPAGAYPEQDPILDGTIAPFTRAFTAYLRSELGYRTDLAYILLSREVGRQWQWHHGKRGGQREVGAADALADALSLQPRLKLLIAHGMTDLTTPYMMSRYIVDHLPAKVVGERVSLKLYTGGHMMYLRPDSRQELHDDAAKFYGE